MTDSRFTDADDGTGQCDDASPGDKDRGPVRREVLRAVAATGAASALAGCGGNGGGSNNPASGGNSSPGGNSPSGGSSATATQTAVVPDCDSYESLEQADVNGGATLEAGCYRIEDTHEVDSGTLVLEPGVLIEFGEDAGIEIQVDAGLESLGTDEEPVVLRGATADRGFWQGISFTGDPSSTSVVEHTVLAHAGGGPWNGDTTTTAALFAEGVTLDVRNSSLHHNAGKALMSRDGETDLTVTETRFEANEIPTWIPGNLVSGFDASNVVENNDDDRITVQGRTSRGESEITTDQEWQNPGVPFYVAQQQHLTAALTVGPGVAFDVAEGAGFDVEGGQLEVMGTEDDPVRFRGDERERGFWHGIGIQNATEPNRIQHVVLRDAGGDEWTGDQTTRAALFVEDATLDVRNGDLHHNAGKALMSRDGETDLTVTETHFEANETPVRLHANLLGGFDHSNVVENNDDDRITVLGSTDGARDEITAGQTWENPGVPFYVVHELRLTETLVVGKGTTFDFAEGVGLDIHGGRLEVSGTEDDPVRFRGEQRQRGFWQGIRVGETTEGNRLQHTVVADAGGRRWHGAEFSRAGVFVEGSDATVHLDACTITNNAVSGFTATGQEYDFTVENCAFVGNAVPIWTNADLVQNVAATNTYAGNDSSRFRVGIRGPRSTVLRDATWPARQVPYHLARDLTVHSDLEIAPATTVEAGYNDERSDTVTITVPHDPGGSLKADASDPHEETIVFTGSDEDAGHWGGIHFSTQNRNNTLQDVVVEYGGGEQRNGDSESLASIAVWEFGEAAGVLLEKVVLRSSGRHGIYKACSAQMSCSEVSYEDIRGSEIWDADEEGPVDSCTPGC